MLVTHSHRAQSKDTSDHPDYEQSRIGGFIREKKMHIWIMFCKSMNEDRILAFHLNVRLQLHVQVFEI